MPRYSSRNQTEIPIPVSIVELSDNKEIKLRTYSFTYPLDSGNFSVNHDLPDSAIVVGFSIGVEYAGVINQFMPPNFDHSTGFHFQAYVNTNSITVRSVDDGNLLGRNGNATIWYYE